MNGLLDTVVLVDLLRAYPPALDWLAGQEQLGITPDSYGFTSKTGSVFRCSCRAVAL